MKVAIIIRILEQVSSIYGAGGAVGQQKDLTILAMALQTAADLEVKEWVEKFNARKLKAAKRPVRQSKELNEALVSEYVTSLKAASNAKQIADLIAQLKKDKAIDKRHLFEIAAQFSGDGGGYSKKEQAITSIQAAFVQQQRFNNKLTASHLA